MKDEFQIGEGQESQDRVDRRRKRATWIIVGVTLYAIFVLMTFHMETTAREECKVPSKADIAALDDRVAQVKAETARGFALDAMAEWLPYAIFDMVAGTIVLGGWAVLTILGAIFIWRNITRNSVSVVRNMVIGTLLVSLASMALLFWPSVVAQNLAEKKITDHLDGVQLTVVPVVDTAVPVDAE